MLVWKYISIFVGRVLVHSCTCRDQRSTLSDALRDCLLSFLDAASLTGTWDSPTILGLLTNEPQGSACLCLPSTPVLTPPLGSQCTSMCRTLYLGLGDQAQGHRLSQVLYQLSCLPIPLLSSSTKGKTVCMPKIYFKVNVLVIYHQQMFDWQAYFM